MNEERTLLFCGDIHGELRELVWRITNRYKLSSVDVIILGDFGLGFDKTIGHLYERIQKKLEKHDICLYSIRGNHDNPEMFGKPEFDFPRLKFLGDHQIFEIDGRKIYTIGGACSTDVAWRKKWNNEHPKKPVWWEGEGVIQSPLKDLPGKVDIIISHTAPISFEPTPVRYDETPLYQYEKILAERHYLDDVHNEITADYWYYGHFHSAYSGSSGRLLYKGLGIMELCEAPRHKNTNPQEPEE